MAKRYPPKLKFQVVLELLQGQHSAGQLAKSYGIHTHTIKKWQDEFVANGPDIFSQESTTRLASV